MYMKAEMFREHLHNVMRSMWSSLGSDEEQCIGTSSIDNGKTNVTAEWVGMVGGGKRRFLERMKEKE